MNFLNETDHLPKIVMEKYAFMSIDELRVLCEKMDVELHSALKKNDIVFHVLPDLLNSSGFLEDFYYSLEPEQQDILKFIVNYNGLDVVKAVKQSFGFNIILMKTKKRDVYVWWLELFIDNNQMDETLKEYYFEFLHDEKLQKEINGKKVYKAKKKEVSSKVPDYLDTIEKKEVCKYDFKNNLKRCKLFENSHQDMIENIRILYQLSRAKKILITQKHQFAVRTIKLMKSSLSMDEDLYPWLVNLLVDFKLFKIDKAVTPTKKFDDIIKLSDGDFLKEIYKKFIVFNKQYELQFVPFASRVGEGNSSIQNLRKMIINAIKKSDTKKWISCDSIVEQIPITEKTLKYLQNGKMYAYGVYHYNKYKRKELVYDLLSDLKVVVRYFVKAFIGLLNRFSICEIAYTPCDIYVKEDLEILAPTGEHEREFKNIEYFKLNEIGLYCLEISSSFKSKNDFHFTLDPYLLELYVDKPSNLSQLYLENIATKMNDTKYRVDFASFMKNVNSVTEYKTLKQTFLEKTEQLPRNWQDFFAVLDERIESASIVAKDTILIKLQKNRELLKLIATNTKLQAKILKADNLHIVVYKQDLVVVKNIFKEYGVIL